MKTYKPLSTVTYNTPDWLKNTLDSAVKLGHLSFYAFIPHIGENGKKDHIHVYVEPTTTIDTESLAWKSFLTQTVEPPSAPLDCKPWKKSKFEDWLLYALHDSAYLSSKQLVKEVVDYPLDDVISSDVSELKERHSDIDMTRFESPMARLMACYEAGMTPVQAMSRLRIPYGAMSSFLRAWEALRAETDNRTTHQQDALVARLSKVENALDKLECRYETSFDKKQHYSLLLLEE